MINGFHRNTSGDFLRTILHKLGIDGAVASTLYNRFFGLFKTPLTMLFILRYLTAEQQGIWYTFNSLIPLTALAELGFTVIITQFVSHEYAKLKYENGIITGEQYNIDKLFSLIRYAIKFYTMIIPTAIVILLVAGSSFLNTQSFEILIAWYVFSLIGGLSLFGSLLQSIFQGLNKVRDIQKNIFLGSIVTTACNLAFLYLKLNIWALVIGNGVGLIVMLTFLYLKAPQFWKQLLHHNLTHTFPWFKEIVTLQWKYAVTWISGYLIFFLFVPAAYKYQGSIVAGQLGLTLSLIGAVSSIADPWVGTKLPQLNMLVATGKNKELIDLFTKSSIQSFIVTVMGSVGLLSILFVLSYFNFYQNRLLSIPLTAYLLLSNIPVRIILYLSMYLRAHKIEPFYLLSVLNAALIAFCVFVVFPRYGLLALIIGTNIVYWCIILPYAVYIYRSFNRTKQLMNVV